MRFKLLSALLLIFCINFGNLIFCDGKADLFLAIFLDNENFNPVKQQIMQIQSDVTKAANAEGYKFKPFIDQDQLHITLEYVEDVNIDDIPKYERCIQNVVDGIEEFDISENIKKTSFSILGDNRKWGILEIPRRLFALTKLVRQVRYCFKQNGLKMGIYNEYRPHISLGNFLGKNIPDSLDLDWVPEFEIVADDKPLIINKVILKTKNKTTGNETFKVFKLKQYGESMNEQEYDINAFIEFLSKMHEQEEQFRREQIRIAEQERIREEQGEQYRRELARIRQLEELQKLLEKHEKRLQEIQESAEELRDALTCKKCGCVIM